MTSNETIACVGELLWDVLPDGRTLGGAPANVAYHLGRLGHVARLVTRVGRDEPGGAARAVLAARGIDVADVQMDGELPTGAAHVTLDSQGHAAYRFVTPAEFATFKQEGLQRGFRHVESGPLVRSSYHAHEHVPQK